MAEFSYVAKDGSGKVIRESLAAASRHEAVAALRDRGLTVIELLEPSRQDAGDRGKSRSVAAPPRKLRVTRLVRVNRAVRAMFFRQLAISVGSAVPLRESLESIAEDIDRPGFRAVLQDIVEELHRGRSFSEALAQHEAIFGRLFIALIRSAEEAGTMAETLEDVAAMLERSEKLARRIRSITAYPMFVAAFFGIVCLIMTLFILPQFRKVFGSFNAELPRLTVVVFNVNRFIVDNFVVIALGVAALCVGVTLYGRTLRGRFRIDTLKLRLPVFGLWIKKLSVARFARHLSMMLRGGVPVATAIEIASGVCGNRALERALLSARARIIAGSSIANGLYHEGVFPRLLVRMVGVGESSGRLPHVLDRVSGGYEDEVESSIMIATSLLEPVVICLFGSVILVLVLAIYMPVFTVASNVR